ncbi:MAG: hypothetical protein IJO24_08465 [Clostridia bacterium]|nr:hypothetical protein [Clostridia bacterium]
MKNYIFIIVLAIIAVICGAVDWFTGFGSNLISLPIAATCIYIAYLFKKTILK